MCLPVTSQGPLGSTPPVGIMAVVFPEFRASRTSIHVISSIQTVVASGSGFGVSAQLYTLLAQLPPPSELTSRCCAHAAVAVNSTVPMTRMVLIVFSWYANNSSETGSQKRDALGVNDSGKDSLTGVKAGSVWSLDLTYWVCKTHWTTN